MGMKLQSCILKLQALHPDSESIHHDAMFLSSFSVICPETIAPGQGVFEME